MAEIFQTFLLIATFDIALISITIANYAVSASYLGRETRLTRRRLDTRKDQLNRRIQELQAKGTVEIQDLKSEIQKAVKESKKLGNRITLLSWSGAVIVPCILFITSFIIAVYGLNLDDGYLISLVASPLFLAMGFSVLLAVIGTIDSAARQIPLPEFDIVFEENAETLTLKRKQEASFKLYIYNKGEDIAENVEVFVFFPPAFEVLPRKVYEIFKQDTYSNHPNYICVVLNYDLIHSGVFNWFTIKVKVPDEKRDFVIPVYLHEGKIGEIKTSLTIKVTD